MKRIATLLVLLSAGLFTIGGCEKPEDKKKAPAPAPETAPMEEGDETAPMDETAPAGEEK